MNTSSIANGMWCSASSITTSWTSLAGTSGIWTFLMISSRPQTAMTASTPSIPALATASLIASATTWLSRTEPSAMVSAGSPTVAIPMSRGVLPFLICTTLTALVPISSPKLSELLRSLFKMFNTSFPLSSQ